LAGRKKNCSTGKHGLSFPFYIILVCFFFLSQSYSCLPCLFLKKGKLFALWASPGPGYSPHTQKMISTATVPIDRREEDDKRKLFIYLPLALEEMIVPQPPAFFLIMDKVSAFRLKKLQPK
jgi:hypothetical protein